MFRRKKTKIAPQVDEYIERRYEDMAVYIHHDIASNRGLICYYASWLELMMEKFNFSDGLKTEHSLIATDSKGRNIGCSGAVENHLKYYNPVQHESIVKSNNPHSPESFTNELPIHSNGSKEVNSSPTEIHEDTALQFSNSVTKIVVRPTPNTDQIRGRAVEANKVDPPDTKILQFSNSVSNIVVKPAPNTDRVTVIRGEAMGASIVDHLDVETGAFPKVCDGIETGVAAAAALPSTSVLQSGGKFGETCHSHTHMDVVEDCLLNEPNTDTFNDHVPCGGGLRLDSTDGRMNEDNGVALPGPALGRIESEGAGNFENFETNQKQTPILHNAWSGHNHRPKLLHVVELDTNKQSGRSKICTIL